MYHVAADGGSEPLMSPMTWEYSCLMVLDSLGQLLYLPGCPEASSFFPLIVPHHFAGLQCQVNLYLSPNEIRCVWSPLVGMNASSILPGSCTVKQLLYCKCSAVCSWGYDDTAELTDLAHFILCAALWSGFWCKWLIPGSYPHRCWECNCSNILNHSWKSYWGQGHLSASRPSLLQSYSLLYQGVKPNNLNSPL